MKNKLVALIAVTSVIVMIGLIFSVVAESKQYELEKAVRLQTLTNMALNNGNYDLACKAQQEATNSIVRAGVIDVIEQADVIESEICSWAWTSSIAAIK